MKAQESGRDAILRRIKQSLQGSGAEAIVQAESATATTADERSLTKTFTHAALAGGASVTEIASLDEITNAILAADATLPLSIAPQAELKALPWRATPALRLERDYKHNNCNGLVIAEAAAAETGTVAISTHSCPSGLLFLTERLFIVLRTADINADYEAIWALRAGQESRARPRTLHLISGPSRTADVEQTIQIGAHGPRQLDILLLDSRRLKQSDRSNTKGT